MPIYEYQCEACGQRFEQIQKFSDAPVDVCSQCSQGPVRRLLSSPAIQFKGAGWYITDYARKGGEPSTGSSASGSNASTDAKTESKPADTTPAPSTPAKD